MDRTCTDAAVCTHPSISSSVFPVNETIDVFQPLIAKLPESRTIRGCMTRSQQRLFPFLAKSPSCKVSFIGIDTQLIFCGGFWECAEVEEKTMLSHQSKWSPQKSPFLFCIKDSKRNPNRVSHVASSFCIKFICWEIKSNSKLQ